MPHVFFPTDDKPHHGGDDDFAVVTKEQGKCFKTTRLDDGDNADEEEES